MAIKIDYDSIPRSYREYLELMVKEGEYLAIDDEVDWDLEIGAICRLCGRDAVAVADLQQGQGQPGVPRRRMGLYQERHPRPTVVPGGAQRGRAARCLADGDPGSLHPILGKQPGASAENRRCIRMRPARRTSGSVTRST